MGKWRMKLRRGQSRRMLPTLLGIMCPRANLQVNMNVGCANYSGDFMGGGIIGSLC